MKKAMIHGGVLAVALGAATGLAAQTCPNGRADAMAGLTVVYEDETISHYQLFDDDIVTEETEGDAFGPGYVVRAMYGLYVLDEYDLTDDGDPDEGTREVQDFGLPMAALPAPVPGLRWSGQTTVKFPDEPAMTRLVTVAVDRMTTVDYGGCVYDSLPVVVRHRDNGDDGDYILLGFDWLPSLGIAVFRSFADFGSPADSYLPLSITARGG